MGCRKILFLYHESQGPEGERIGRDRAFEELGHRELLVARQKMKTQDDAVVSQPADLRQSDRSPGAGFGQSSVGE
jgi:hypothetical protein